jgi:hypothetical protein
MRADYRPDNDGLRAVAVLSVLFYHYGAAWLPGGFVGVDVFFVISGYLITRNLRARVIDEGLSAFTFLVDFYNGRIRRIFPAALVMLAGSLGAGPYLLMPGDYADLGQSAAYSAFGTGNLFFYRNTGYFDREAEMQPLLHMWSLGVEEQLYLLWPLFLAGFLTISRGQKAITAGLICAVIVASLTYTIGLIVTEPKAAFYWPQARAWELAAGAALVFLPSIQSGRTAETIGAVGLALVAWSLLALNKDSAFPGPKCRARRGWRRTSDLASIRDADSRSACERPNALHRSDLLQPLPLALADPGLLEALCQRRDARCQRGNRAGSSCLCDRLPLLALRRDTCPKGAVRAHHHDPGWSIRGCTGACGRSAYSFARRLSRSHIARSRPNA